MFPRKENENMSTTTKQAINLMELLPESEQNFALEFIKKLVIAWDPDFTKVTPAERAKLEEAQREIENGENCERGYAGHIPAFLLRGDVLFWRGWEVESACPCRRRQLTRTAQRKTGNPTVQVPGYRIFTADTQTPDHTATPCRRPESPSPRADRTAPTRAAACRNTCGSRSRRS